MEEFWKWIAGILAGALMGQGILMWKLISEIRSRPTFEQVAQMIDTRMNFTPYEKDRRWLTEELTALKKDVETVDRHVQDIRPRVEELHLWMTLQRESGRHKPSDDEGVKT